MSNEFLNGVAVGHLLTVFVMVWLFHRAPKIEGLDDER